VDNAKEEQPDFQQLWRNITRWMRTGLEIPNWTSSRGYLGDSFQVVAIADTAIVVETPKAKNLQHVARRDFEYMYRNWASYCRGEIRRGEICKHTRVSKYTISILRAYFEAVAT